MIKKICCFTGHRPKSLGVAFKDRDLLKKKITEQIEKAIKILLKSE